MKVFHLLGKSYGGIRQHVAELDKELEVRGFESVLAGPMDVMGGLADQEFVIPTPNLKNPWSILRSVFILRKITKEFKVLHAHGITAGYLLWFSQIGNHKKPLVLTTHNVANKLVLGFKFHLVKLMQDMLFNRVDKIIAPSEFALSQLKLSKEFLKKSMVVLPVSPAIVNEKKTIALANRQVTRSRFEINEEEILLLCIARISKDKDLPTLIRAFKSASQNVSNLRLLIAGRGNQKNINEIQKLIKDLDLESSVNLVGFIEDVENLIAAADIGVLSSYCETVPLALLEFISLGIPFLSTDVGIARQVLDGNNGGYVPVGDWEAFSTLIQSWSDKVVSNTIDGRNIEKGFQELVDRDRNIQPLVDVYVQYIEGNDG